MSTLTREEAWQQLTTWTETDSLRRHARAVEVSMRAAALAYGPGEEAVEAWGIAGMLHDADYEKWPEDHPNKIVSWLRERSEEELAHSISAHYTQWALPMRRAWIGRWSHVTSSLASSWPAAICGLTGSLR